MVKAVLARHPLVPRRPLQHASRIAELRERELDRHRVERHIQQVQAEFALEVERHLVRQEGAPADADARFMATVAAQCVAAATFAAMTTWMRGDHTDLARMAGN